MNDAGGLMDKPMTLGSHLGELRNRLVVILICMAVVMVGCFSYQVTLKEVLELPLLKAIDLAGEDAASAVGLSTENGVPKLKHFSLLDAPMTAVTIAIYVSIVVVMPIILFQIWRFIAPGLRGGEKSLATWFLPGATIFFYAGAIFGFYIGLPYFFSWLIEWASHDTTATSELGQRLYYKLLFSLVLCFGAICDIPWAVLLLVRLGIVTPKTLAAQRKYVILGAAVLSAVLSPPDPMSQVALLVPMLVLFEIGLFASRFIGSVKKEKEELAEEPQ